MTDRPTDEELYGSYKTEKQDFDLLGLKLEETTEPFDGACTATHPLIIENAVKFQSKASQELFPSKGPVKTQIVGAQNPEKEKQAQRVKYFMNYLQLKSPSERTYCFLKSNFCWKHYKK